MTNNKSQIVEDLVTGPEVITGPKWLKKERVDEGEAAVVTLDGKFREILPPGPIYLAKYPVFTQCKMYYVKTKDRQLTVSTTGELTIMHPAPVLVDLSVVITYRVTDPRVVALEVENPVGTLFDFTLEAMRHAVQRMQFEEFLVGGQASNWILQTLRARGLREYLGLEMVNVNISHIGANERVQQLLADESLRQREVDLDVREQATRHQAELQRQLDQAYNERDISKLIDLTPEFVALYKPELFATAFGDRQLTDQMKLQVLAEMAKAGIGGEKLENMVLGVLDAQGMSSGASSPAFGMGAPIGALTGGGPNSSPSPPNTVQRLRNEYAALQNAGYNVMFNQLDTGDYVMVVILQDEDGDTLNIYIACSPQYPLQSPQVFVELNGVEEQYQSALLRNWTSENTTVEVVREVMRYYS